VLVKPVLGLVIFFNEIAAGTLSLSEGELANLG
jgi:hypothetical protein